MGSGNDGSDWFKSVGDNLGFGDRQQKRISAANAGAAQARTGLYNTTSGILGKMAGNDDAQIAAMRTNVNNAKSTYANTNEPYIKKQEDLQQQTEARAKDSRQTYTEQTQPAMKNMMEDARKEAGFGPDATSHPMTLQESMDPNNKVHQANEAKYNTQAANEGKRGMADVSLMQNLGAQNTASQMNGYGGMMTGGIAASMAGANMSQAGQAMANVQRRQNDLRDQGVAQGYAQSDTAYNRGLDAKDRYNQATVNNENAGARQDIRDRDFRTEDNGYQGNIRQVGLDQNAYDFGMNKSMAGMEHDYGNQQQARTLANEQQYQTGTIEGFNNAAKAAQATQERQANQWSGLMGGASGLLGGKGGGLFSGLGGKDTGSKGSTGESGKGDLANFEAGEGAPTDQNGDQANSGTGEAGTTGQAVSDNSTNSGGVQPDMQGAALTDSRGPYGQGGIDPSDYNGYSRQSYSRGGRYGAGVSA